MNSNRLYLVDTTNPEEFRQQEVSRSKPNETMPTVDYEVPVDYEVHRIKVVVGYGNTDTYLYVTRMVGEVVEADAH